MKKSRKTNRRLQLRKQALRQLDHNAMDQVAGGTELADYDRIVRLTADCGGCWYSMTSHTGGADIQSSICF